MSFSRLLVLAAFAVCSFAQDTALDRYVAAPDSHYKYQVVNTVHGKGYTTYIVELTSQQWRSASEVNQPLWKHWLLVVRPDEVKSNVGMLFINGGTVIQKAPADAPRDNIEAAIGTHSVIADLYGVPNEPLTFTGDDKIRTEDDIIAYSWVKYLKTGDDTWPLQLPMTKAAVRAMDTVTALCASPEGGGVKVEKFVVTGASKRGWATWLTAAVDKRVVAIIPMVIDMLNQVKSFEHHYQAYGYYSPAVKPYQDMGLMTVSDTPQYRQLMKIVDPFSYRERYTMPKFIINASGDQFFVMDSSQFYFDELPGEKYLRYVPNTKHNLNGSARESLLEDYSAVVLNQERPKFRWRFEKNGDIRVTSLAEPSEVRLWAATDPEKRDFRLDSIGSAYKDTVLTPLEKNLWVGHVEKPAKGWTAYFVELTFPSGGPFPFKFTTPVRVTPDTLPFPAPKEHGKISDLP